VTTATPPQLRLPTDGRDRAALAWLSARLSKWTCHVRRRRKRLQPGPLSENEVRVLQVLGHAEGAVHGLQALLEDPKHTD